MSGFPAQVLELNWGYTLVVRVVTRLLEAAPWRHAVSSIQAENPFFVSSQTTLSLFPLLHVFGLDSSYFSFFVPFSYFLRGYDYHMSFKRCLSEALSTLKFGGPPIE